MLKRLIKPFSVLLGIFGLILLLGFIYQSIAVARDVRVTPPPGVLVEVNGQNLHLVCKGQGSPTVLLEAGIGGSWLDWVHVHDDLAATTQVCAYDRLGKGWSDKALIPQTSSDIANTLHNLVKLAELPAPYVLVGHSAGGLHVKSFKEQFPDEVLGMVLVDAAHGQGQMRLPEAWSAAIEEVNQQLRLCSTLAPFGLIRLLNIAQNYTTVLELTSEQKAQYLATFNRTQSCGQGLVERQGYNSDQAQNLAPTPLGELPLIVISRGIGETDADDSALNMPETVLADVDAVWNELQEELAALSTNSTHIVAKQSAHFIQVTEPDLVIEAVQQIIQESQQ